MNLRTLNSFLILAEELNFSRAAERLNIAQPALSQQIRLLEERLGVTLVDRTSRPLRLTEAGLYFRNEAQQIDADYQRAVAFAQDIGAGRRGWFGVGFTRSSMYSILPAALSRFVEAYPDIDLKLYEMLTEQQAEALRERRIHLGIARDAADNTGLGRETLLAERLVVVLPARHRRSGCRSVDIADLAGDPFILFPKEPNARFPRLVRSICAAAGFSPRIAHEAHEIQTALGLVAAGLGVTLVAASVARHRQDDLKYRPLRTAGAPPTTTLQALFRPDETQPHVRAMLEILHAVAGTFASPVTL